MSNEDTLSRVLLSKEAHERWLREAVKMAAQVANRGILSVSDIPDEMARVEKDGSLTIYVPMPDGTELSMRCEPHEWAWGSSRNH